MYLLQLSTKKKAKQKVSIHERILEYVTTKNGFLHWHLLPLIPFTVDSMESHGSVVTHLLSQVKIGMDLTKVALPTFILERRSLLEMYADYFAHPDQFVRYWQQLLHLITILDS